MLEVGSVNEKNTRNILLKNILDASLGAIIWYGAEEKLYAVSYLGAGERAMRFFMVCLISPYCRWLVGFGIATGKSSNGFIGGTGFGLVSEDFMDGSGYSYATWLFQVRNLTQYPLARL